MVAVAVGVGVDGVGFVVVSECMVSVSADVGVGSEDMVMSGVVCCTVGVLSEDMVLSDAVVVDIWNVMLSSVVAIDVVAISVGNISIDVVCASTLNFLFLNLHVYIRKPQK